MGESGEATAVQQTAVKRNGVENGATGGTDTRNQHAPCPNAHSYVYC